MWLDEKRGVDRTLNHHHVAVMNSRWVSSLVKSIQVYDDQLGYAG